MPRLITRGPTADHHRLFQRRRPPPGAPPGATVASVDLPAPRLAVFAYDAENLYEREGTRLADVLPVLAHGRVRWLDVQGLGGIDVVQEIGAHYHLHPLVLADILNLGQRPKVELYDDALYCVVRMVTVLADHHVHWEQFSVVIKADVVLTFQETHGDCLDPLRLRLRQGRTNIRSSGPDYLAAMVIDAIADGYFPAVETYGEVLERLEDDLVRTPTPAVLRRVYRVKRELLKLRRATWPLRDALTHLLRDAPPMISQKTLPYLRDVTDHVMQVVDIVETYRELAASFVEIYLSSMAQRTNEIVRALTVLAAIFIPLTFLAGVYGMNFTHMPELHSAWGYPAFWIVCVVTTVVLLVVFKRLGWIGGEREVTPPREDDA